MRKYKVEFIIELEDPYSKPNKWIPDAVYECLNPNDDVTDWKFTDITGEDNE